MAGRGGGGRFERFAGGFREPPVPDAAGGASSRVTCRDFVGLLWPYFWPAEMRERIAALSW